MSKRMVFGNGTNSTYTTGRKEEARKGHQDVFKQETITALIFGFDDSTLSQRLLINVLLKSCISVLFIILVELVSMWLGSLCKDAPMFY